MAPPPSQQEADSAPLPPDIGLWHKEGRRPRRDTSSRALSLELCCAPSQGRLCGPGQEPGDTRQGPPSQKQRRPQPGRWGRRRHLAQHSHAGQKVAPAVALDDIDGVLHSLIQADGRDVLLAQLLPCFPVGGSRRDPGGPCTAPAARPPTRAPPTPCPPRQTGNRRPIVSRVCCCSCLFHPLAFFSAKSSLPRGSRRRWHLVLPMRTRASAPPPFSQMATSLPSTRIGPRGLRPASPARDTRGRT